MPVSYYYMGSDGYFILLLAVFVLGLFAQARVQSTFNKYAKVGASANIPASDLMRRLIRQEGLSAQITQVGGSLTDHYNPKTNVVGLSETVYDSASIAALAVAAHEVGHVMQYEKGYGPIRVRNAILPIASIGSQIAPWIVIFGLMFSNDTLALFGIVLFGATLLFQLITLPVEFNASSRAIATLEDGGYLSYHEVPQAKKVLRAAAFTYVVAAMSSLVTLLRLLGMRNSRRR